MSETTSAEEKWIVQYKPWDDAPWMCDESFLRCEPAKQYLQANQGRHYAHWRLVHRHTVTTVTEEVIE